MVSNKHKTGDEPELRPFASSPCLMHELGPDFLQFAQVDDWASIVTWRKEQRTRLIAQRKSLNSSERLRLNEAVCENLECEARFFGGCIGFYWPLDGEIDLRPLMHKLLGQGADLALPVMVEKDQPMEFWAWNAQTQMQNQPIWNIPAPIECNPITPSVLFVPLLGFDLQAHRLGHGGGYYDRTLAAFEPKPLMVGIGYEYGRLETIYPQDHDVPMDVIVTEQGLASKNA